MWSGARIRCFSLKKLLGLRLHGEWSNGLKARKGWIMLLHIGFLLHDSISFWVKNTEVDTKNYTISVIFSNKTLFHIISKQMWLFLGKCNVYRNLLSQNFVSERRTFIFTLCINYPIDRAILNILLEKKENMNIVLPDLLDLSIIIFMKVL